MLVGQLRILWRSVRSYLSYYPLIVVLSYYPLICSVLRVAVYTTLLSEYVRRCCTSAARCTPVAAHASRRPRGAGAPHNPHSASRLARPRPRRPPTPPVKTVWRRAGQFR